jgi:HEAT repeat protein
MRQMTLMLGLVLAVASIALGQQDAELKGWVSKLPADDVAAARGILAEIVKLGPAAVSDIAGAVVETGKGNDAGARFALNGLAHHVSRPGAEDERAMYVGALIDSLKEDRPAEVKAFLISMLQRAGREESVAPVAKYLTDRDLSDYAARALSSIGTKSAGEALITALPDVSDKDRPAILRAIGVVRYAPAARKILPYANSEDAATRSMARFALAQIGAPEAAELLIAAAADEGKSRHERAEAVSLSLFLAERLAEAGQKGKAVAMCRDLIGRSGTPAQPHVATASLSTLTKLLGQDALDDVLKAYDADDKTIRAAALELANGFQGDRVVTLLTKKLDQVDAERRVELVQALGRRQDEKSWEAVVARLKDEEKPVRLAAVDAVARRANDAALAALLPTIRSADAEESGAIGEALRRIPDDAAMGEVASAIQHAAPPGRVALLETLAARRARDQFDTVLSATRDEEPSVRVAAIKALRDVGTTDSLPRMLELLPNLKEEREQSELMQSVVAVALRTPDQQKRAEPVLAALSRSKGHPRRVLLRSLPQLGGPAALEAVVKETQSEDRDAKDAAVRALSDWRDASAAPHLLVIAQRSDDSTHEVLALRGYLRLAGLPDKRPAPETVAMYTNALAAAKRADDRRLALSGLANVRDVAALKLVAEYAADEQLGAEAALAAIRIVTPQNRSQQPLTGPEVNETLARIAAEVKDEETRGKLRSLIKEPGVKQ